MIWSSIGDSNYKKKCTCRPLGQPTSCIGTSQKAAAARSITAPNRSAAHGSLCTAERVRRIPGVVTASNLMKVSDPLYSLSHAETHTRGTFHGLHGVDNQMMRDIIRGRCHIAVHDKHRDLPRPDETGTEDLEMTSMWPPPVTVVSRTDDKSLRGWQPGENHPSTGGRSFFSTSVTNCLDQSPFHRFTVTPLR